MIYAYFFVLYCLIYVNCSPQAKKISRLVTLTTIKEEQDKLSPNDEISQRSLISDIEPINDANKQNTTALTPYFRRCCKAKNLPPPCIEMCDFRITPEEAREYALIHKCPLQNMQDYLSCMSNNMNNTDCCESEGVIQGRLAMCQPLCNPSQFNDFPKNSRDMAKYFRCQAVIHKITTCHMLNYHKSLDSIRPIFMKNDTRPTDRQTTNKTIEMNYHSFEFLPRPHGMKYSSKNLQLAIAGAGCCDGRLFSQPGHLCGRFERRQRWFLWEIPPKMQQLVQKDYCPNIQIFRMDML
uniref:Domain of unknown function DB domain-containing protein n=1 Tax=Romanomermis culicivorax TaxID=13658 RepID=A0A915K210_ROMCU